MSLKYKDEDGKIYELESGTPSRIFDPESEEAMSGIAIAQQLPFKLGIDEEGNYGYYKDGADTVTPFKQKEEEPVWKRPEGWADLDLLAANDEQGIYYTFDNRSRDILFSIQLNTRNYKVEILDSDFNVLKTYNSTNVKWLPAAGYFNDIDIDYPIIKITSTDNITSVSLQSPYSKTGISVASRLYSNIVEAYYKLPKLLNVAYFTTYHTKHIKLIDCTSLASFYQAFQDARKLELIELENCDTSKVTSYLQMCWANYSLNNTDFLKDLDCANCTTLRNMFYNCYSLESIDFTQLKNTEKIEDMCQTFNLCSSLRELKIDGTKFPSLTTCKSMLASTCTMQSLDLSGFDVSNADHSGMLSNTKIFNLKLPKGFSQSLSMTNYIGSREEALALVEQLGQLPTGVSATLTIGSGNLKFLTDEEKAAATDRGWTLA